MKYATLNGIVGAALVVYGQVIPDLRWFLTWFGGCFLSLGMAYALHRPDIYGKRMDGRLPLWSWLLFFPLHAYTHLVWHLLRWLSREPAVDIITENLCIGRRLLASELPPSVKTVVDLTAEFAEPTPIVRAIRYCRFPILDADTPKQHQLREFIATLSDQPVYIHCAQGHGRTGVFTLALLLERGICNTLAEAKALLAKARPALRLNKQQERFLQIMYPAPQQ